MTTKDKDTLTEMTREESLALIAQVMKKTQKEVGKSTGVPFIIWGGVTTFVSIVVWFALMYTNNRIMNLLWLLIPVLGSLISVWTKRRHPVHCSTELSRLISRLWLTIGSCVMVFAFAPMLYAQITGTWPMHYNILFVISLLLSVGTTITGIMVKENMTVVSGGIGLVLVLVFPLFTYYFASLQVLYFGCIFFATMFVPGVFLNRIKASADV
ncbi:MAG TPA: hypothetical protein PLK40_08275 [Bacteroidaceae bacterium]|nr:hypothetical protein [Bacteroidaceae bacterium]